MTLYAIIDAALIGKRIEEAARKVIDGGAEILQLRAKEFSAGKFLEAASALREIAFEMGIPFIVNDRVDVACLSGADGVHLGQTDIPVEEARRILGPGAIIGLSTHSVADALTAMESAADYISLGPIFSTTTKKKAGPPLGPKALGELMPRAKKPVVAIGGIRESNLPSVIETGVDAVAIISDILLSSEIREKTSRISSIIASAGKSGRRIKRLTHL